MPAVSDGEREYIRSGVLADLRDDGRARRDYRPLSLETGLVSHACGSVRLTLPRTQVLVAVKAQVAAPSADAPDRGILDVGLM